ncbi:MAG TPA: hypothetical protein VHC86_07825 [Opitutaceae bacterium]|nr:hypothetical protein [Opitutaceae bacterium]
MRPDVPFEAFLKMAGGVFAILFWLAAALKKRSGHGQPPPPAAEEEERTRRVREEVARKIAARRRQESRFPAPLAPFPAPAPASESDADAAEDSVLTAPVRAEEQKLVQQVKAMQAAEAAPAPAFTPYAPPALSGAAESPWLAELREPGGARRAVILREILGPPLSLR